MVHLNPSCNTHSHWLHNAPYQQPTTTPLPTKADIVIIGGGITGLSTAYWLTKLNPTQSVVVLEARGLSSGATGRNGGIICPGLNDNFDHIVQKYGEKEAERLVDFDYRNVDMLAQFLEEHGDKDNGSFDPQITWLKHGTVCAWTSEQEAYEALPGAIKLKQLRPHEDDIEILSPERVQEITGQKVFKYGGLQIKHTAIAWAARIVYCLARAVEDKVHLATFTSVQEVRQQSKEYRHQIITNRGIIEAKKVAYCTNAWTKYLLPTFQRHLVPIRNQVVSVPVPPVSKTENDAAKMDYVLSANRGFQYLSYRPYDQTLIFGGCRNTTAGWMVYEDDDSTLNQTVSCHLRGQLEDYGFPHFPEREWVGTMGFSIQDGLPFVGDLTRLLGKEKGSGQYIAAGFSGHGMPRTFLCGRGLAQLLSDQSLDSYFPEPFLVDHSSRHYLFEQSSKL
ncbi:FAD dependent oxidoreductase [Halteromyces radiatus]|uniref:FAD dependent oxidoreductase n=1 Tax=Halteromyces radiatus TaxID=101107 RepID=UPI00221F9B48|nr:FAD dependent oxidoreductase [Halteromyces radiatus]KAI8081556.1 FAD dependent oxidoreductase [Halteromyces radiatus]